MKITVSVIKADVGGIGGHTRPSDALIQAVRDTVNNSKHLLIDHYNIKYQKNSLLSDIV